MFPEEKVMSVENLASEAPQTKSAPTAHAWIEEIEVTGDHLVARVKQLIAEGNVRRLIIRTPEGKVLFEVPLTAGVAVGGVVTILAPILAALGALAALVADVKVEIVREPNEPA